MWRCRMHRTWMLAVAQKNAVMIESRRRNKSLTQHGWRNRNEFFPFSLVD